MIAGGEESGASGHAARVGAQPRTTMPQAVPHGGDCGEQADGSDAGTAGPSGVRVPSVLVVEDEAIVALDIERRLLRLGLDVTGIADDRASALALCARRRPDLVLMDIRLRGGDDGIDVADALRAFGDPPIIFVTAYNDRETVARAAERTPYGFLTKPFDDRVLGATIDIALKRAARDALLRTLGTMAESASIGILLVAATDRDVRVDYANAMFRDFLCDAAAGGASVVLSELMGLGDADASRLHMIVQSRRHFRGVMRATRASRQAWAASVLTVPLPIDAQGRPLAALFVADVSSEVPADTALVGRGHLEMTVELARGVAHDVNNLLTVVAAVTDDLSRLPSLDTIRESIDSISAAVRNGALLVRRLLHVSHLPDASPGAEECDVGDEVQGMQALLQSLCGRTIDVSVEREPHAMVAAVERAFLVQVLLNLATNARDALGGRAGTIRVVAYATRVPSPSSGEAIACVRLSFADDGPGIPAAFTQRIFERDFSTKPASSNFGIGLALIKAIVERSGGSIAVDTREGVGTAFHVDLPWRHGAGSQDPGAAITAAGTGPRCLVVASDAVVRSALAAALVREGVVCVSAGSVAAARALLAANAPGLAAVVAEVPLDDDAVSGFVAEVSRLAAGPKCVVMAHPRASAIAAGAVRIVSPCRPSTVAATVRALVDGAGVPVAPVAGSGDLATANAPALHVHDATAPADVLLIGPDMVALATTADELRAMGYAVRVEGGYGTVPVEAHAVAAVVIDAGEGAEASRRTIERLLDSHVPAALIVTSAGLDDGLHAISVRHRNTEVVAGRLTGALVAERLPAAIAARLSRQLAAELRSDAIARLNAPRGDAVRRNFLQSIASLQVHFRPIGHLPASTTYGFDVAFSSTGPIASVPDLVEIAGALGELPQLEDAAHACLRGALAQRSGDLRPLHVPLLSAAARDLVQRDAVLGMLANEGRIRWRPLSLDGGAAEGRNGPVPAGMSCRVLAGHAEVAATVGKPANRTPLLLSPRFLTLLPRHASARSLFALLARACRLRGDVLVAHGVDDPAMLELVRGLGAEYACGAAIDDSGERKYGTDR